MFCCMINNVFVWLQKLQQATMTNVQVEVNVLTAGKTFTREKMRHDFKNSQ